MRARGLQIERQMDFIVHTRCPEEVKSHHTEGSEKVLLTGESPKTRRAFLSLRPGAQGYCLGFSFLKSAQGTGTEPAAASILLLFSWSRSPISNSGRDSVSVCGGERTQPAAPSILGGFYKQSRILILGNSAAIPMVRPSKAIHSILVNKLIYILLENSFPKDPQGFLPVI